MNMANRSTDTGPGGLDSHTVKITREIPLWGILTALGAFVAQTLGLYYSNVGLTKASDQHSVQLSMIAAEVKALNSELNAGNLRNVEISVSVADIKRRLQVLEDRPRR